MTNEWKPIEQAPKDGTRIIGIAVGLEPHCYYYHQTDKQWWIEYADGASWQPTHYQTMPEFKLKTTSNMPNTEDLVQFERVECRGCTFQRPYAVNKYHAGTVMLWCRYCQTEQRHDVLDRPSSLLDTLLEESPQEAIV